MALASNLAYLGWKIGAIAKLAPTSLLRFDISKPAISPAPPSFLLYFNEFLRERTGHPPKN
jgi:hypothetical protein